MQWPKLPTDRKEAAELCARGLALAIATAMMFFFFWVLLSNAALDRHDAGISQRILVAILQRGPMIGGFLGMIPTIISSGIALTYRNPKVDLTFYFAVSVISLSIVMIFSVIMQFLYTGYDMDIAGFYFELSDSSTFEEIVKKSINKIADDQEFQYRLVEAYRGQAVKTMGVILLWYVAVLAGLLGIKITESRAEASRDGQ